MQKQPTVRQINEHLSWGRYCYVYGADGNCLMRISRARTRKGKLEGRVIAFSGPDWMEIPADATVALTRC